MKTLKFTIEILAQPEKVWNALWDKQHYTQWTKPFTEGCYYETEAFTEGSKINFLSQNGDGMISKIAVLHPGEYVAFEHLGMVYQGKESSFKTADDTHQYLETYRLTANENGTTLTVEVDTLEPWEESMNTSFPKALQIVKEISEQ